MGLLDAAREIAGSAFASAKEGIAGVIASSGGAAPLVGALVLATPVGFAIAASTSAQARAEALAPSCAVVSVAAEQPGGAESLRYVWGKIDGEVHAIFKIGGATYAIPAENFRHDRGVLSSAGGEALPASAIPSNALPASAIPAEAIPSNAIPSNAIPSNLVASEVMAAAMPQVAAGGFLTLNNGSVLRHTWMERDGEVRMAFGLNGYPYEMTVDQLSEAMNDGAIPSNAIPAEAIPAEAIPAEAIPSNAIPSNIVYSEVERAALVAALRGAGLNEAIPSNGIPSNAIPAEAWSKLGTGVDAIPAEAIPSNAIPSNAIPSNAIPAEAIPAEAIPSNFVSAIPAEALLGMLSPDQMVNAIPAEAWATANELGIPDTAIPSNTKPWTDLLHDVALQNPRIEVDDALPSSALPASALPSSAIPSNSTARDFFKAQTNGTKGTTFLGATSAELEDMAGPNGVIHISAENSPDAPTMLEALLAQFEDGLEPGTPTNPDTATEECQQLIRENDRFVVNYTQPPITGSVYSPCRNDQVYSPALGCLDSITATVTDTDADDVDWDSDGFTANEGDCGPHDPEVGPGPGFVWNCDLMDVDDDGNFEWIDEDDSGQEWGGVFGDADGDGWLDEEDCAPFDRHVSPGAAEVVGDGIDNDCDGEVDEGFVFDIIDTSEIFTPPSNGGGGGSGGSSSGGGSSGGGDSGGGGSGGSSETIDVSFAYWNSDTPRTIWETPPGSECPEPRYTWMLMWVTVTRDGQVISAGAGDLSSATISWSGGGFSGSKSMSWEESDLWFAEVGHWGQDSVESDTTLTVTVRGTTPSGATDSGSGTLTLKNCDTSGVEYGGSG